MPQYRLKYRHLSIPLPGHILNLYYGSYARPTHCQWRKYPIICWLNIKEGRPFKVPEGQSRKVKYKTNEKFLMLKK